MKIGAGSRRLLPRRPACPIQTGMTRAAKPRLSRDAWLDAGLAALRQAGPAALGAEPLARRIGATKGSFYWHFRDVPEFQAALLGAWEATELRAMQDSLPADTHAAHQLRVFAQRLATRHDTGEAALRAWAAIHPPAAITIARIDAARRDLLAGLLAEIGITNPEIARLLQAAATGMAALGDDEAGRNADAIGSLADLILALRE